MNTQNTKIVLPKNGSYENLQEFLFIMLWENAKSVYLNGVEFKHTTGLPSAYYDAFVKAVCEYEPKLQGFIATLLAENTTFAFLAGNSVLTPVLLSSQNNIIINHLNNLLK